MTPLSVLGIVLVAAFAFYLRTDPLKISMANGVKNFHAKYVTHPLVNDFKNFPRDKDSKLQNAEIKWQGEFHGPESVAFDLDGRGPYTGISDGRILRYDGPELGWTTFAYTSNNRSEVCVPKNPGGPNSEFEHICGRPLGLQFHKRTGELWIADAYFGIMKVGLEGGQAEVVLNEVDGVPLMFTNDFDFDDEDVVYFVESSQKWPLNQVSLLVMEGDNSGRFIKYDPATKETTVLIDNLAFGNGVATSKDSTFVVIAQTIGGRMLRYWLKGEKAGTYEKFVELPGWSDNVRCNGAGDFWVAVWGMRPRSQEFLNHRPWLRSLLVRLPIPQNIALFAVAGFKPQAVALRYGPDGQLKEVLEDQTGKVTLISEVQEHDGKLYLGSVFLPHIAIYTIP